MNQQQLGHRVEILERKVESLAGLPERVASVELQISQFRDEVRVEFSAVRQEMGGMERTLRQEIQGCEERLRQEMRALNQDTRTHMLVLHEEVISGIATLASRRPVVRAVHERSNARPEGRPLRSADLKGPRRVITTFPCLSDSTCPPKPWRRRVARGVWQAYPSR